MKSEHASVVREYADKRDAKKKHRQIYQLSPRRENYNIRYIDYYYRYLVGVTSFKRS